MSVSKDAPVISLAAARDRVRDRDAGRSPITIDAASVKLGVAPSGGILLKWDTLIGGKWVREETEVPPAPSMRLTQMVRAQQAHLSREAYYAANPDKRPKEKPRRETRPRCGLCPDGTLGMGGACRRVRLHDGPCRGASGEWAKVCAHQAAKTKVWVPGEAGSLPPPETCGWCGVTLLESARARNR